MRVCGPFPCLSSSAFAWGHRSWHHHLEKHQFLELELERGQVVFCCNQLVVRVHLSSLRPYTKKEHLLHHSPWLSDKAGIGFVWTLLNQALWRQWRLLKCQRRARFRSDSRATGWYWPHSVWTQISYIYRSGQYGFLRKHTKKEQTVASPFCCLPCQRVRMHLPNQLYKLPLPKPSCRRCGHWLIESTSAALGRSRAERRHSCVQHECGQTPTPTISPCKTRNIVSLYMYICLCFLCGGVWFVDDQDYP